MANPNYQLWATYLGRVDRLRCRGHLLVVDDEHHVALAIEESLSRDHDIEIELRPDGVMRRIDAGERFDLILCDVMMLECTGPELWSRLAVEHPDQAARVVFMTEGVMSERARASLAAMPNLCIRRPFDVDGMRALVWRRMALGRAGRETLGGATSVRTVRPCPRAT